MSLECAGSRVPIALIGLLGDKDVLVGAVDVATDQIETPEQVAAVIRAAMAHVPAERIFPCTNCGMVPRSARWRGASCSARAVRLSCAGARP